MKCPRISLAVTLAAAAALAGGCTSDGYDSGYASGYGSDYSSSQSGSNPSERWRPAGTQRSGVSSDTSITDSIPASYGAVPGASSLGTTPISSSVDDDLGVGSVELAASDPVADSVFTSGAGFDSTPTEFDPGCADSAVSDASMTSDIGLDDPMMDDMAMEDPMLDDASLDLAGIGGGC